MNGEATISNWSYTDWKWKTAQLSRADISLHRSNCCRQQTFGCRRPSISPALITINIYSNIGENLAKLLLSELQNISPDKQQYIGLPLSRN
jgi:hypothetical protein